MDFAPSSVTKSTAKSAGLELWMNRALERADRILPNWKARDIHDCRVALRRCRTMADALNEVVPDPGWRKLKKTSRDLFHALGELRDGHIELGLVKKLGTSGDPLRKFMTARLNRQEKKFRKSAARAIEDFDRKYWRKAARKLNAKIRFYPLESIVFQRVALANLNQAARLYEQARKKKSSVAWHQARIGLKRFRYVVENFLPQRHAAWADDLKQMQDLLGALHDLDVLRADIRRPSRKFSTDVVSAWIQKIDEQRNTCLRDLLAKGSAAHSPWDIWRSGLQWGQLLETASEPRRRTA